MKVAGKTITVNEKQMDSLKKVQFKVIALLKNRLHINRKVRQILNENFATIEYPNT